MYLTRFQFNPMRKEGGKLLEQRQYLHAAVLAGFADSAPTQQGRVLWRIDKSGERRFLVLSSPRKPDLSHLVEQAGWPASETTWETRDYKPLLDRLQEGQRWGFRLTANPTKSLRPEHGQKRGKVEGLGMESEQLDWLGDKSVRHGFSIVNQERNVMLVEGGGEATEEHTTARVFESERVRFSRKNSTVTLQTASFDGVLEVIDTALLREALTHGIGSAKGYGCGLMTLVPVG